MTGTLKEGPLFIKRKHELADIAKRLDKITDDALDLLSQAVTDAENLSLKDRLRYAEVIIDLKIRVTDQISKDDLTRQIAAFKANGARPLIADDPNRPAPPRLDMHTIQKV